MLVRWGGWGRLPQSLPAFHYRDSPSNSETLLSFDALLRWKKHVMHQLAFEAHTCNGRKENILKFKNKTKKAVHRTGELPTTNTMIGKPCVVSRNDKHKYEKCPLWATTVFILAHLNYYLQGFSNIIRPFDVLCWSHPCFFHLCFILSLKPCQKCQLACPATLRKVRELTCHLQYNILRIFWAYALLGCESDCSVSTCLIYWRPAEVLCASFTKRACWRRGELPNVAVSIKGYVICH